MISLRPMDPERLMTIEDMRLQASRRLPTMIANFIEGGADDEVTLRRNVAAFSELTLEPRYLVDVSQRDISTSVLGSSIATPVGISPTALMRLVHHEGELAVARAAGELGAIFVVSVLSSYTMEEIAEVATAPLWFQMYLWKQRDVTAQFVERAAAAGYQALMLTVDVPVLGLRERDLRNGMSIPPKIRLGQALDFARRPRWVYSLVRGGPLTYGNMRGVRAPQLSTNGTSLTVSAYRQWFDPSRTWEDLEWLRTIWDGPLIIKGITHPEDAIRAADTGVDAIAVSNHGGRQLDGAPATLDALPRVVDAVADRGVEVIFDGGIRRGSDVVKAVALGAGSCMVGRPCWWGLAVAGADGVRRSLEILNTEIDRTLALIGRRSIDEVTLENLGQPVPVA